MLAAAIGATPLATFDGNESMLLTAPYLANRQLDVPRDVAAPSCLIGASNFFELAVATANLGSTTQTTDLLS